MLPLPVQTLQLTEGLEARSGRVSQAVEALTGLGNGVPQAAGVALDGDLDTSRAGAGEDHGELLLLEVARHGRDVVDACEVAHLPLERLHAALDVARLEGSPLAVHPFQLPLLVQRERV